MLKGRSAYLKAAVAKSKERPQYKGKFNSERLGDDRFFQFDIPTAYYVWKNAMRKPNFLKRMTEQIERFFHPHVLRKFFRS